MLVTIGFRHSLLDGAARSGDELLLTQSVNRAKVWKLTHISFEHVQPSRQKCLDGLRTTLRLSVFGLTVCISYKVEKVFTSQPHREVCLQC